MGAMTTFSPVSGGPIPVPPTNFAFAQGGSASADTLVLALIEASLADRGSNARPVPPLTPPATTEPRSKPDKTGRATSVESVAAPAELPAARAAHQRLNHLASLPAGWDGAGSAGPNPAAIKDAKALVVELVSAGIEIEPAIGLDSDGTVSLLFMQGDFALGEIVVLGDGTYSYFVEREGKPPASGDGARIGWPIPRDLCELLML